jgi:thioredoxin 1
MKAVIFTAEWCSPCRIMKQMYLYELQAEGYDIQFVDVEQDEDLKEQHTIASVPTTLFYKDDAIVNRIVGFMPKDRFIKFMEE